MSELPDSVRSELFEAAVAHHLQGDLSFPAAMKRVFDAAIQLLQYEQTSLPGCRLHYMDIASAEQWMGAHPQDGYFDRSRMAGTVGIV